MARCHTDCLERRLRTCFEVLGSFIGSHPWWFLLAPVVLSAGLGSGFYFLTDRMSNDIEEQFTPADGRAKMERKYIQETFPGNESVFSRSRLSTSGCYATVIATSDGNILREETLQDVLHLDRDIRTMSVQADNQSFAYVHVCAEVLGSCSSNDVLDVIKGNASNVTFPWYQAGVRRLPLYLSLGSVKLHRDSSVVESAEAMQLYYYLRGDTEERTKLWLESFIHLVSNESSRSIQVSTPAPFSCFLN